MVDMQVRMQDVAHVAEPQPVFLQLVLDHGLVGLQPAHPQRLHDLVRAIAGIDHHRPGPAENEKAEDRHPAYAAAIAAEHQEARFEFDVAVVENFDFKCHLFLPRVS